MHNDDLFVIEDGEDSYNKKKLQGLKLLGGAEYSSRTINFNSSMTASQIQALIDGVGKYLHDGVIITFQFADGTYSLEDTLTFAGFWGGGEIFIYGNSSDNTLSTTKNVNLNFSATGTGQIGLSIRGCRLPKIWVHFLKIEATATTGMDLIKCHGVYGDINIRYCYLKNRAGSTRFNAYFWAVPGGRVLDTYFTEGERGICASGGSNILSYNNPSTGTNPDYGLYSDSSIIYKDGTQPTGSTANEYTRFIYIMG